MISQEKPDAADQLINYVLQALVFADAAADLTLHP